MVTNLNIHGVDFDTMQKFKAGGFDVLRRTDASGDDYLVLDLELKNISIVFFSREITKGGKNDNG